MAKNKTKTVVFESERITKWESRKRFVIPAAALCGVLLVTVVAALIIRGSRGRTHTGGEDTPYPYVWMANKDGSVRLEVSRTAAPQYYWIISEESTGVAVRSGEIESENSFILPVLSVEPDEKQSGEKASILLTPAATGRAVLLLDLRRGNDEQDQIYEMTVLAEVLEENGKLRANLIGVTGTEQQGVTHGGENTAFPYTVRLSDAGDLLITVTARSGGEGEDAAEDTAELEAVWECASGSEEILSVLGVLYASDDVTAYVRAGAEAGRCAVRMASESVGAEITLDCEVREDGTILVLSHDITVSEIPEPGGEIPAADGAAPESGGEMPIPDSEPPETDGGIPEE